MSLFKFQNYSAIKNAQDNPRGVATVELKNGYLVTIKDNEGGVKEAITLLGATDKVGAGVWVVGNIVNKPEILNTDDFVIKVGEPARCFNLAKQIGEILEISGDLVDGDVADVNVGDILVPGEAGIWEAYVTGDYEVGLEVTDITTFGTFTLDGGLGLEGKLVKIVDPA